MIASLRLENYRCFEHLELEFNSGTVVIRGANGQGKTSILESVFYLANLRSFRTARAREIVRIGSDMFRISASVQDKFKEIFEVEQGTLRRMKIDGRNVSKASEFVRAFRTVAFLPDDPLILTGASVQRRRFFDMFISMMDRDYFFTLQKYASALKSRNELLRCGVCDENVFSAYEQILSETGSRIVSVRMRYVRILSDFMRVIFLEVRPELSNFQIRAKTGKDSDSAEAFAARLKTSRDRDRAGKFTSFGPHMDDFDFLSDDKSLRIYGSRGQCRIAAFALKLAELDIVNSCGNAQNGTVVLVDDATGDLDDRAKNSFFERIVRAGQVFHAVADGSSALAGDHCQFIDLTSIQR